MTSLFGGSKQTPEEVNQIRTARTAYQDYLSTTQTNTTTDVTKSAITPESGQAILKQIQDAQAWLKKNPNANYQEVLANRDATTAEIDRIKTTDAPKRVLKNAITMLPSIADLAVQRKYASNEQATKLKALAKEEDAWYKKNSATATKVDFDQEYLKLKSKIQEYVVEKANQDYIFSELEKTANQDPVAVASEAAKQEEKAAAEQDQEVSLQRSVTTVWDTAWKVFWRLLLLTLCILAGSFAANIAIGRAPAYRVLYFLYAAIPFFMPFVLFYTLYRRISYGRLPMYAVLPVSIEPATTRFGRFFWWPFYWVPDEDSMKLYKEFENGLKAMAST